VIGKITAALRRFHYTTIYIGEGNPVRWSLVVAVFVISVALSAQRMSIQQLTRFLDSSVRLKQPDKEVAGFLSKAKLTERLDDHTIEDLRVLGIGPKTLSTLRQLRDQSRALPVAQLGTPEPKPAPIQPPSPEEQASVIQKLREYASNYSRSLPDFICTQVVRRYLAATPGARLNNRVTVDPSWQLQDTLTLRLSYFEQKEDYKLILVNDSVTQEDYGKVGGATTTGEFGSMLKEVFARNTSAHFEWDHWATLRGRRALTFSYQVAQMHAHWALQYEHELQIFPAYSGLIYVDQQSHQVLRITLVAQDIPASFPIQEAETILDYDYQALSGHSFLLPLKAENRMQTADVLTRNDVEFRLYRKFSSESEIKYDTPDPLPEDQTKEGAPR